MSDGPDLSIVIETSTAKITGACPESRNLEAWAREAAGAAPRRVEVLVIGAAPVAGVEKLECGLPPRFLHCPGAGYYALKNAGANAARGNVVLFTDADCRPGEGFVRRLLAAFEDPRVIAVAGRSFYDGTGLLTRLNTAHSFAYLHRGQKGLDRTMPLTHNLAMRRLACERDPFGPFAGRVGGDRWVTESLRARGHPLLLVEDLVTWHENPTFSLRGTAERHLREHFRPLRYGDARRRYSPAVVVASALGLRTLLRLGRVIAGGRRIGLKPWDYLAALPVNFAYWLFDLPLVLGVLLVPALRRRWLAFQFGPAPAGPSAAEGSANG